jgi:hypothetical protein
MQKTAQRVVDAPKSIAAGDMTRLSPIVGNQALTNLVAQHKVQTKMTVGAAHDGLEQEADNVARQVVSGPAPKDSSVQRQGDEEEVQTQRAVPNITRMVQRSAAEEEEVQTSRLQRSAAEEEEVQTSRLQRSAAEEEEVQTSRLQRSAAEEEEVQTSRLQRSAAEEEEVQTSRLQRSAAEEEEVQTSRLQRSAAEEEEVQTSRLQRSAAEEEEVQTSRLQRSAPEEEEVQTSRLQRDGEEEEEEEVQTSRKDEKFDPAESFEAGPEVEQQIEKSRGSGAPLSDNVRDFMEPRFGADFSGVRLHTGSESTGLNRALSAQAFTRGSDIYLGEGHTNVESSAGQQLLAHELTHVIQQGGTSQTGKADRKPIQRLMPVETVSNHIKEKSVSRPGKFFGTKTSSRNTSFNNDRAAMLRAVTQVHYELSLPFRRFPDALKEQLTYISQAYDNVIRAANDMLLHIKGFDDPNYQHTLDIRVQATNEKTQVIKAFMHKIAHPPGAHGPAPTVGSAINPHGRGLIDDRTRTTVGTVGGGMNQLTEYAVATTAGGGKEYFKPNVASIAAYENINDSETNYSEKFNDILIALQEKGINVTERGEVTGFTPGKDAGVNYGMFGTLEGFARAFSEHGRKHTATEFKEKAGINTGDLRSANREVAMSRLDILLDANLISKAELAIQKTGLKAQARLGSMASGARGKEISKYRQIDRNAVHPGTPDAIKKDDPVLMSKLSALEMIDFLAGQADRHQGNYMIQVDHSGNVLGLTGIDNDMSFGTKSAADMARRGARELPSVGLYFDQDMANKILALDPALVKIALSDLLTPEEVQATLDRLQILKDKLRTAQAANKLLAPNQWAALFANYGRGFRPTQYNEKVGM